MDEKKKIDVSSSSLIGLKAELLRKQEKFKQERLSKAGEYIRGSGKLHKVAKKPSIWSKQNQGIKLRMKKDEEGKTEETRNDLEKSRAMLEAKTMIYEKMVSGKIEANEETSGVFLVDFEKKQWERFSDRRGKNAQEPTEEEDTLADESEIPPAATPDEEWVDYIDTLGRSRRCMKKDLPDLQKMDEKLNPDKFREKEKNQPVAEEALPEMLSSDMYREMLRKKWEKEQEEALNKGNVHYQDVRFDEVRNLGVGYFDFSKDEEERKKQMDSLKNLRDETINKREQRERLKAKRKAALQERLEKVKQRRNIQTEKDSDQSISDTPTVVSSKNKEEPALAQETKPDTNSKMQTGLGRTLDLLTKKTEKSTKVREWDIDKVKPSAWEKQREKERDERPAEFAPPSIYSKDSHGQQGKSNHWRAHNYPKTNFKRIPDTQGESIIQNIDYGTTSAPSNSRTQMNLPPPSQDSVTFGTSPVPSSFRTPMNLTPSQYPRMSSFSRFSNPCTFGASSVNTNFNTGEPRPSLPSTSQASVTSSEESIKEALSFYRNQFS